MNNETQHQFNIKMRKDGCYDIYVDGKHITTKGSVESAVIELENIMLVTRESD